MLNAAIVLYGPGPAAPWPVRYIGRWLRAVSAAPLGMVSVAVTKLPMNLNNEREIRFPVAREDRGPVTHVGVHFEGGFSRFHKVKIEKHPDETDQPFIPAEGLPEFRVGLVIQGKVAMGGRARVQG